VAIVIEILPFFGPSVNRFCAVSIAAIARMLSPWARRMVTQITGRKHAPLRCAFPKALKQSAGEPSVFQTVIQMTPQTGCPGALRRACEKDSGAEVVSVESVEVFPA
jgi:hypothetical protein